MKIPKTLKVGGHIYKVFLKELDDCSGETDMKKLSISIDKNAPQSVQEATLIHEIMAHCINSTFAGENHIAHGLMDSLSEQMYQVLSENKMLK